MFMLPYLQEVQNNSKKYSVIFRGLNYTDGWQDGEFAQTQNLSTDAYPCITQRPARVKLGQYSDKATAIHAKGKLLVIDGNTVMYDGKEIGTVDEGRKQIATVGNYIVIFPDKVYLKVPEKEDEEAKLQNMELEYRAKVEFTTSSIKITDGDALKFEKGDNVKIEGCSKPENNKEIKIREASEKILVFDDNSFTECTEDALISLTRKVPDLDFVCESGYRLWGTHGNTIYASKFGDPLNFASFDGLSEDSYAIDIASEGEFTGCIPYSTYICFFKENTLHKLYGSKPSNYQVVTSKVYGVQKGSERSMQIINEQLIYKGVGGIYAYTGGVPEPISEKLGNKLYTDAVACSDGEKYYISMKQGGEWTFFAFDINRNIWLREDETQAADMTFHDGKVYYLDAVGGLYCIDRTVDKKDIEWSAVFCTFNETVNERKGYSKFSLRLHLSAGAWLALDMKTDKDTKWKQIYTTHNEKAATVSVPIIPTRCDSIDIRLRGKGECTIKTFIREFTVGSDI